MNINKKATKPDKQINKRDIKSEKEETFYEKLRAHFLSVPMRPALIGLVLLIAYSLVRSKPETDFDFSIYFIILGLAISATGLVAIRRKEFPGWLSIYTGATATMLGWLSLIAGIVLITQEVLRIIQN
jgi:uncharacterized membrane protein